MTFKNATFFNKDLIKINIEFHFIFKQLLFKFYTNISNVNI
jgi:hypothetical protein